MSKTILAVAIATVALLGTAAIAADCNLIPQFWSEGSKVEGIAIARSEGRVSAVRSSEYETRGGRVCSFTVVGSGWELQIDLEPWKDGNENTFLYSVSFPTTNGGVFTGSFVVPGKEGKRQEIQIGVFPRPGFEGLAGFVKQVTIDTCR